MTEQYSIVMNCLFVLKKSNLQPESKLRLQIQLIHLLRLLSEADLGDVNTRPVCCTNSAFRMIIELAEQTTQSKFAPSLVNELMQLLGNIIAALSVKSGAQRPSPFLVGSFQVD